MYQNVNTLSYAPSYNILTVLLKSDLYHNIEEALSHHESTNQCMMLAAAYLSDQLVLDLSASARFVLVLLVLGLLVLGRLVLVLLGSGLSESARLVSGLSESARLV